MSVNPTPKNQLGNTIKAYLFPALVTVLASLIWRDVNEMRADIKSLLAQSNVDKTDIQNLKRDIQVLEQAVFNKKITASTEGGTQPTKLFFKHEDIFDVKDYITKSK